MKTILFICTHNSARSQIAEALVNRSMPEKYQAFSAGPEPTIINPYAVKSLAEIGIDISMNKAKHVNTYRGRTFDYVVTVCDHARETCPFFPGAKKYLHQGFEDPSRFAGTDEENSSRFRHLRDDIESWITSTFGKED